MIRRFLCVAALIALLVPCGFAQTSRPTPKTARPDSRAADKKDPEKARREEAISAGLEWIRHHQSADGGWGAFKFTASCDSKLGAPCGGAGAEIFDAGVTGLALLALLSGGADPTQDTPLGGSA